MKTFLWVITFIFCASLPSYANPIRLECDALLSREAAFTLVKKIGVTYGNLIEKAQLNGLIDNATLVELVGNDFFTISGTATSERKLFEDALARLRAYAVQNQVMGPLLIATLSETLQTRLDANRTEEAGIELNLNRRRVPVRLNSFDSDEASSSFVLSPDGKYASSISHDGTDTMLMWDTNSRKVVKQLMTPNGLHNPIHFSPDNRYVYQLRYRDNLVIANTKTGETVADLAFNVRLKGLLASVFSPDKANHYRDSLTSAAITPDGKTIFTGSFGGHLYERQFPSGKVIYKLESNLGKGPQNQDGAVVEKIAITSDGKTMLTSYHTREVWIWNLKSRRVIHKLKPESDWSPGFSIINDPNVAMIRTSHKALIVDLKTGKTKVTIPISRDISATISPDGRFVLTHEDVMGAPVVRAVWDGFTGERLGDFAFDDAHIQLTRVDFSSDGKYVYAWDRNNKLFQVETKELLGEYL